ncbi:MAG: glycoside hydrolase family 20 zincin-like fold domain-containing protein, partial [Planctomycetota bacterium]
MRSAILVAVGCLMLNALAGEPLVLAKGGQTEFCVVVSDDATEAEKYAAQELAAYLGKLSGAAFAIEGPAAAGDKPAIRLKFDSDLGGEEYQLKAGSKGLTIAGGRPRGVLYGVYALLEDELGCRWFTRDCERVEKKDPLTVPGDLKVRVKPRLEYREPYWTEAFDGDWAARNRV